MQIIDAIFHFIGNIVYVIIVFAGLWFLAKKADASVTFKLFWRWLDRFGETRPLLAKLIGYGSVIIILLIISLALF